MENLKPCPWCGSMPEIIDDGDGYYYYACLNLSCPFGPSGKVYATKEEATEAWNTRHRKKAIGTLNKDERFKNLKMVTVEQLYRTEGQ